MADYPTAAKFVLDNEGGYSNHSSDPGGRTNYGITEETARQHGIQIGSITRDDALMIYHTTYWHPAMNDINHQRIATKLLDLRVQFGPEKGVRIAQEALNVLRLSGTELWVEVDGKLGPKTIAAFNALAEQSIGTDNMLTVNYWMRAAVAVSARSYCNQAIHTPAKLDFIYGWLQRAIRRI